MRILTNAALALSIGLTGIAISAVSAQASSTDRCMDVRNGGTGASTPVQVYDCNGTGAQIWQYTGGALRNPQSNKCLDGNNMAQGRPLIIYPCNGTGAQRWESFRGAGGRFLGWRNPTSGRCIDGNNRVNGRQMVVYTCNQTEAQWWQLGIRPYLSSMTSSTAPLNCSLESHCYAVTSYGSGIGARVATTAVGADLKIACLSAKDPTNDFIDWEMWLRTANGNDGNYWVEAGLISGTVNDPAGNRTGFNWFWADSRPGPSYYEHYIKAAKVNTYSNVTIRSAGTGAWDVVLDNSRVGTSRGNGAQSYGADVGMESTSTYATIKANMDNFQYRNPAGTWTGVQPSMEYRGSFGWVGATSAAGSKVGASSFVDRECASYSAATAGRATIREWNATDPRGGLRKLAIQTAERFGEADPAHLTYVSTRRDALADLIGAKVDSSASSLVVTMTGRFTASGPTHRQVSGQALTMVVDSASGRITDAGLTPVIPRLSKLGTPSQL